MARSDLLLNLVRAATKRDSTLLRRTVEAMIAEERAKQHHVLATRLEEYLREESASPGTSPRNPLDHRIQDLVYEATPKHTLEDLLLAQPILDSCRELIEEHHRRDLLRAHNLEPRNRVLLIGPPGNGKTSLAHAFADALMVPLLIVRYENIIGSYLGETAARLAKLFSSIRGYPCVLFLDEFDTLGKERGDLHETGEIKRVVSSLLLQIDEIPSHVLIVTATNHAELLDRAVWRRFQLKLQLANPTRAQLEVWLQRFEKRMEQPLGHSYKAIAEKLLGLSFAEVVEFGASVLRSHVLSLPRDDLPGIIAASLEHLKLQARPPAENP